VRHRFVVGVLALVAIITVLTIYVVARVAPQISTARQILSTNVTELGSDDIRAAESHLSTAQTVLQGWAANILRIVPVERQNLDAVRTGVDATLPVLDRARALHGQLTQLQRGSLLHSGRISMEAINALQGPLVRAASSVSSLVDRLRAERSGWLIPTVWNGVSNSLAKAEQLKTATATGSDLALIAPKLLGADGPRSYLVLLVNNAEVRPSGGIVSGIGLLKVNSGHFHLGAFHYYTDLAHKPYQRVTAPPDFERRYRRFNADTTRWVNVTLSPDTEEVAEVARKLYRVTAGQDTDGAIVIDPRGVAALLPSSTRVRVPGTHTKLTPPSLPQYVYSNAYRQLGGHTATRHDALIGIGKSAFHALIQTGFGGGKDLKSAAAAVAGGHVRLVSFRPNEEEILRDAGVTGSLRSDTNDRILVTETNFNGTKMDFWSHRTISHTCDVRAAGLTLCETSVALRNSIPSGLSTYVAGKHPYGQLRSLMEVYLPTAAILQRVLLDGQPATFGRQTEDGLRSVGTEIRVAPGGTAHLVVDYALPQSDSGYSLGVLPQPLTHDADLKITLRVPDGWKVSGLTSHPQAGGEVYEQSGSLDAPQTITATPYGVRGISSLWQKFDDFLHRPLI
jgi:Protein of unknown function (DUF4012)